MKEENKRVKLAPLHKNVSILKNTKFKDLPMEDGVTTAAKETLNE
jgi:hypothetical protein